MSLFDGLMESTTRKIDDWPIDYEERFWREYPRRIAKLAAMKALEKVRRSGVSFDSLIRGVRRYAESVKATETKFVAHPTTYLNQGRWDDEYRQSPERPSGYAGVLYDLQMDQCDDGFTGTTIDGTISEDAWTAPAEPKPI